jgi:hypothetical protein
MYNDHHKKHQRPQITAGSIKSTQEVYCFLTSSITVLLENRFINPLTPNDPYRGRTAPLTSKVPYYVFIQQIYVQNILNMVYTLRFFLFKMQFIS